MGEKVVKIDDFLVHGSPLGWRVCRSISAPANWKKTHWSKCLAAALMAVHAQARC
jgi:hypothetical protein